MQKDSRDLLSFQFQVTDFPIFGLHCPKLLGILFLKGADFKKSGSGPQALL